MSILLSLFLILLISTFFVLVALFRATPATEDWREDWPEWLNNAVCILPTTEGTAD